MKTTLAVAADATAAGVYQIQLNSEDGQNRLTTEFLRELAETPQRYPEARGFVLSGNAKYFCVGADLEQIAKVSGPEARALGAEGQRWLTAIADSPAPFGAAIAGYCLGGGLDLALSCRLRVCTPESVLGHRGAKLGIVTGWGGTQRLPRLIGAARALEYLLSASTWSGAEAYAQGLAQGLCDAAALQRRTAELVAAASSGGRSVVQQTNRIAQAR